MNESRRKLRPAIARIWRGRTIAARADEYAQYLVEAMSRFAGKDPRRVHHLELDAHT